MKYWMWFLLVTTSSAMMGFSIAKKNYLSFAVFLLACAVASYWLGKTTTGAPQ